MHGIDRLFVRVCVVTTSSDAIGERELRIFGQAVSNRKHIARRLGQTVFTSIAGQKK